MFTGIIEETGKVSFLKSNKLAVEVSSNFIKDLKIGSSVSVNGACLTVINLDPLTFDISFETLKKTNLGNLRKGDVVNLEKALKVGERLDGHFVLGHVDTTVRVKGIKRDGYFYKFIFEIPKGFEKYIVYKGSVAIDGISLTVARLEKAFFEVAVIPHTYENTNLKFKRIGDICNLETDIFGKYVIRYLENLKSGFKINFIY